MSQVSGKFYQRAALLLALVAEAATSFAGNLIPVPALLGKRGQPVGRAAPGARILADAGAP